MADFSLDLRPEIVGTPEYGDLLMQNGDVVLTSPTSEGGTDQTLQLVCQSLRLWLSEWFMDQSQGTQYLQVVFAKGSTPAQVDSVIKDRILSVPGVMAMTQYSGQSFAAQRLYRITFTIITQTGGQITATVPLGA